MVEEKPETLWYFAYGSNISHEKFVQGRGIVPIAEAMVRIPGWRLTMSIPGTPYREPAFASIEPFGPFPGDEKAADVEGVAYLITRPQYTKIIISEGGDIAYRQIRLRAEALDSMDEKILGQHSIQVLTLTNAMTRTPAGKPSARYMDLIVSGSRNLHFSSRYRQIIESIATYKPGHSTRYQVGAYLFAVFWAPVMALVEPLIRHTANPQKGGAAPGWVKLLVRFVVASMWFYHDNFHSVIWGRGDGLDQRSDVECGSQILDQKQEQLFGRLALPYTGC